MSMSTNDSSVLSALFDPEATLSSQIKIDTSLPRSFQSPKISEVQEQERAALRSSNHENPSKTDITNTIDGLTKIIDTHPNYASAWNNRAQARRLLLRDHDLSQNPDELKSIVEDLAQAISLATPASPLATVSRYDVQVLASAHTHRAYLLWLASRFDDLATTITLCIESCRNSDRAHLEELASREFAIGGRYGNDVAKQLAVKTNPYAKLCGSIVKEAMQKEITDHYQIPVTSTGQA